jgi:hypothetical protein
LIVIMDSRRRSRSRSRSPNRRHQRHRDEKSFPSGTIPPPGSRLIIVPTNLPSETRFLVDQVADFVSRGGMPLEDDIARLQANNPNFEFLTAPWNHPVSVYYRWRLYSLLQGDGMSRWRTDPYQIEGGTDRWWVPPPLPGTQRAYNPGVPAAALGLPDATRLAPPAIAPPAELNRSIDLRRQLTDQGLSIEPLPAMERQEWFSMLRALKTANRSAIADAMVFAIDHSHWAYDLLDTLLDAIGLDSFAHTLAAHVRSTPTPELQQYLSARAAQTMARIFLMSDIFSNVFTASNAAYAAPRHIVKAADFIVPRFFEQVMCCVVIVLHRQDSRRYWGNVFIEASTALWQLVGWVRELWALWTSKGCLSPQLTGMISMQYAFLLKPRR